MLTCLPAETSGGRARRRAGARRMHGSALSSDAAPTARIQRAGHPAMCVPASRARRVRTHTGTD